METYQCEKCNCDIKFGTSYYAIVRSLEFQTFDSETKEEVVEVEEAEEITPINPNDEMVLSQLKSLDPNQLNAKQALDILYELHQQLMDK